MLPAGKALSMKILASIEPGNTEDKYLFRGQSILCAQLEKIVIFCNQCFYCRSILRVISSAYFQHRAAGHCPMWDIRRRAQHTSRYLKRLRGMCLCRNPSCLH